MATISHSFHIDASQDKVLEAISTIEGLRNWWTTKTTGGEQIGEVLAFRFTPGAIIDFKVVENNKSDFTKWICVDAHKEWINTEATFKLSQNEGKTHVSFNHSGWEEQTEFFAHCNFSWGKYLASLRDYCETGTGNPFVD